MHVSPSQQLSYYNLIAMSSKYAALFTSVNLLLGVGPLILPMPFFNAGILLSCIWMIAVCLLSYNSAMFISEAMSKLYQYVREKRPNKEEDGLVDSLVTSQQDLPAEQANLVQEQTRLIKLDHVDQFQILFGRKWGILPCLSISIYLLGTSISKCIMTGKTMSIVFKDVKILQDFIFWVVVFFVSGAVFSFRSIDKTKVMQVVIVVMRVLSILLLLGGAIYLCRNGVKNVVPQGGGVINIGKFVELFSDSVFSLMFHHSLPNIVSGLQNSQDIKFVIQRAFLISGTVLMVIPITGVLAFGQELLNGDGKQQLKFYNLDFKGKIDFIYWFTSFYVFLNIAAFSVYIIVIRSNILHIIYHGSVDSMKISKKTVITSVIILVLILLMSWLLKDNIQVVLDFTGGVFGIFILFLMPCIQVFYARKKVDVGGGANRNYFVWLPVFIFVLGLAFMGLNLYFIITKLEK